VSRGSPAALAAGPALTEEQERPVSRRTEPLLLSAGAGSGKTSVLVERFVRAVREDGTAPGRILAITFTDRAAGELRERVRARFLELGEREAARDTEAAFVGTFHGFCARVLRAHPLLAELDPDFAILDEGTAGSLRGRAFSVALRRFLGRESPGEAVDLLGAYGVDRVYAMIAAVHAQLRSRGQRMPRLPQPAVTQGSPGAEQDGEAAAACGLIDELLVGFSDAYDELKHVRSAVDFDDLELLALALMEGHQSVRTSWSERFELLMVDEFQDTNPRQLGILGALERGNLFTVGDEFQSIYGFRHADVSLFRGRRRELAPSGASLALTRNFRSRAPLLEVVNAVFEERFVEFAPLLAGRGGDSPEAAGADPAPRAAGDEPLTELLLTDRCGWEDDAEIARGIATGLPSAPLWRQAEACMLAQRVAELVHSGRARAGEVVVLLRALGDIEVYEQALRRRGLRTLAAVGAFWEHQQVGDLLAYLRTLANPLDELALYSTLASPLVGVSRDGLALLAEAARADGGGAWETALRIEGDDGLLAGALSHEDRAAIADFCERLRGERERASRRPISELIERAIAQSGYEIHALGLEWGERRLANLHKLLRLARRFEASEGRDLRAFLDHVAYLIGASSSAESDAPVDGAEPDAVRLMSIHAAKGLEFPVVCVADLGRAPNTRMGYLLVDGARLGLQLVRLDGGKATPTLDYSQLAEERRAAEAAEEDRILYVAMTRARERLILSAAVDLQRWPEARPGATAISWLGPALAGELPTLAQSGVSECDLTVGPLAAPVHVRVNTPASAASQLRPGSPSPSVGDVRAARGSAAATGSPPAPPTAAADRAREPARPRSEETGVGPPQERMSTLSYTSLTELERCGYRYYLERVLGLPEERMAARSPGAAQGSQARARGILVHRLLESLDFARPAVPAPAAVEALARELGIALERGESARIAELLQTAVRSAPARRIATAREVRREHPFAFSLGAGEPLVTGVIDLLARESDGVWVVLDYKSDRVGPDIDLGVLVERDYAVQRLLYALAVLRKGASRVEIVHWFLDRPEDPVAVAFEAGERVALELSLAQRLARARERGFAVAGDPHRGLCLTCPGRASLCSWGEEETMREHAPPEGGSSPGAR